MAALISLRRLGIRRSLNNYVSAARQHYPVFLARDLLDGVAGEQERANNSAANEIINAKRSAFAKGKEVGVQPDGPSRQKLAVADDN